LISSFFPASIGVVIGCFDQSKDQKDGSVVVKGGGGEGVLDCRGTWRLFNGNVEHETQPVGAVQGRTDFMRVSVIVFSNSNYNKLPPFVVEEMQELGFTAQSSDGEDLPYFKRFRIDKKVIASPLSHSSCSLRELPLSSFVRRNFLPTKTKRT
jgi:hypothetical protein